MQRPQTSLVLFHCRFGDHGLRDHQSHGFELATYLALPNLFAVCAVDERWQPERMVSGLLVKTDLRYEDPAFLDGMSAAFDAIGELRAGPNAELCLVPSPVDAGTARPLDESEALHVFRHLWSAHLAAQVTRRCRQRGVDRSFRPR